MMTETTNSTAVWAILVIAFNLTYRLSGVAEEGASEDMRLGAH